MNTVRFLMQYTINDDRVHITPLGVTFSVTGDDWTRITGKVNGAVGIQELTIPQFMQLAAEANKS